MSVQSDIAESLAVCALQAQAVNDAMGRYAELCGQFQWEAADAQREVILMTMDGALDTIAQMMKRLERLANG